MSGIVVVFGAGMLEGIWNVNVGNGALLGWGVAFFVANMPLALLRCPRCGERFFYGPRFSGITDRCLHCGLRWGE